MTVGIDVEELLLAKDREISLLAARKVREVLCLELAREDEELRLLEREFYESPSYRIGSMLCPNSRL